MAVFCTWVGRVIAWGRLFDESPFGDEEIVALVSELAERYLSSFSAGSTLKGQQRGAAATNLRPRK